MGKLKIVVVLASFIFPLSACGGRGEMIDLSLDSHVVYRSAEWPPAGSGIDIDPVLAVHYDSFMLAAESRPWLAERLRAAPPLRSIRFVDALPGQTETVLALCTQYVSPANDPWRVIEVKRRKGTDGLERPYTTYDLRSLVFHELGHCKLSVGHNDDGEGLMRPSFSLGQNHTREEWEGDVEELLSDEYLKELETFPN